eukprot:7138975-Prorocentrum_lima.AAC.1
MVLSRPLPLPSSCPTDELYDALRSAHDRHLLLSASGTARAASPAALLWPGTRSASQKDATH